MTGPCVIRAADCQEVAWKNGGGTTREIASAPAGAGIEAFDWRLSTARVAKPGAFSHFAGVDRTIAILSGRLRLEVAGHPPTLLTPETAAHDFAGDRATVGIPLGGEVLDLNLMVRRGRGKGAIRRCLAGAIETTPGITLVFATEAMRVACGARSIDLAAFETVLLAGPLPEPIALTRAALVVTVRT